MGEMWASRVLLTVERVSGNWEAPASQQSWRGIHALTCWSGSGADTCGSLSSMTVSSRWPTCPSHRVAIRGCWRQASGGRGATPSCRGGADGSGREAGLGPAVLERLAFAARR